MGFSNTTDFQDNYVAQNNWRATLSSSISNSDTSLTVTGGVSSLPEKGWVSIGTEHIYYGAKNNSTNTLSSLERGVDGSTAGSHAAGATVEQRINAAAFNTLMSAVKKRRAYELKANAVTALGVSTQNLTGFASRARLGDLNLIIASGTTDCVIEFYKKDTFKGIDRLYKTANLESVETTTDQISSGTTLYVTSTDGFLIDELVAVGNPLISGSTWELAHVEDITSGDSLTLSSALSTSYAVGQYVRLVHRDQTGFYYEDLDWTAELHTKIINNDALSAAHVYMNIIAEVSDEN